VFPDLAIPVIVPSVPQSFVSSACGHAAIGIDTKRQTQALNILNCSEFIFPTT